MSKSTTNKRIQDMNIPVILLFKRQAIRVFPDNTKVATYYNDKLKKTITIPYSSIGINETMDIEQFVTNAIKKYTKTTNSLTESKMVWKKINEDDKSELKQVKKWIKNTRTKNAAGTYNGKKPSDNRHLDSLNKEKKELKRSIKSVYREKNLERTKPKDKNQLVFDFYKKKR